MRFFSLIGTSWKHPAFASWFFIFEFFFFFFSENLRTEAEPGGHLQVDGRARGRLGQVRAPQIFSFF